MIRSISLVSSLAGALLLAAAGCSNAASDDNERPSADRPAAFSEREEAELGAFIRAYLMENPEVIVEAVQAYSEQEQAREAARRGELAKEFLSELRDPKAGFVAQARNGNAKVSVIELYDYHCGFCKRAVPIVRELIENESDVELIFREFPILREESDFAAEASLAAREQGKFLELHYAMMESEGVLTEGRIGALAKKVGLDFERLKSDAEDDAIPEAIIETQELARKMAIGGTPAFIIASADGGFVEVIDGFRPADVLASIDEARAADGRAAP